MAVSKIGIDFSSLSNVQFPEYNISNTSKSIFEQIPEKANQVTGGWLGYGIITTLFITVFLTLTDRTPFGDFGYANLRALSITFAICSIFSLVLLNINFINNILVVATSVFSFMLTMIIILVTESQE